MTTISKQRKEIMAGNSLYQRAAKHFGVSYSYVAKIAQGARIAGRGKGAEIKQFLINELKKLN